MNRDAELEEIANALILAAGRLRQLCYDKTDNAASRGIPMSPSVASSPEKLPTTNSSRQRKLSKGDNSGQLLAVVRFLLQRGGRLASRPNIALLSGFVPSDPLFNSTIQSLLDCGSLAHSDGSYKLDASLEATLPPASLSEVQQAIEAVIQSLPAKQRALMRILWERQGRPASISDLATTLGRAADAKLRIDLADLVKKSLAESSSGRFSCNEVLLIS